MGTPLYFIFLAIILIAMIIIGKTVYYRKKIPCMTGMMIAMTLGMSIGLILGVIFGILFPDNLFIATIYGMVAGMAAGFLAGLPVSIMAVLDGLLSGLMGGMMGAMLGVMIAMEYRDAIVKIMFFLFLATILILAYMIQKEVNRNKTAFYLHPIATIVLFGLLFFIFNQAGPLFIGTGSAELNDSGYDENGNSLLIKTEEYNFLPDSITVKVRQTVTLSIENTGKVEHDLEIIDFIPNNIQQNSVHDHNTETNNIHLHAGPGEKQSVSFTPQERGVYRFICTIPGHKEAGMFGIMEVS